MNRSVSVNQIARAKLEELLFSTVSEPYVATGLQEDIIYSVGCGKYQIILAVDANRVGKTAAIMNIARQIMWPDENPHFNFWDGDNIFRDWPFSVKRFRITGTPTNLADNGPIQTEMEKWWPRGKYQREKAGKHHYSSFKCGDWQGDALTYEQPATEYEGQTLSLVLSDEPPKPALIGAINSRMAEGGIWVIGMTPVHTTKHVGVFLDMLEDLKEKGKRVRVVTGSVYENDIETGKANHNNTKRGLWTKRAIDDWVAGIPLDEQDARVKGIASHKSGKIYPMFDEEVHVIDFDYNWLRQCNCYMSIDPHRKAYPAIIWFAVTKGGKIIVYNEYPKYEDLNDTYYDEVRKTLHFKKQAQDLANIMLSNDFTLQYGAKIVKRVPDPHFDEVEDFVGKMVEYGVHGWEIPERQHIEIQRTNLQGLLGYNKDLGIWSLNDTDILFDRRCRNTIRSVSRHYWQEGKDKEAEDYKDFVDSIRNFLASCGGQPVYFDMSPRASDSAKLKSLSQSQMSGIPVQGYRLSLSKVKR